MTDRDSILAALIASKKTELTRDAVSIKTVPRENLWATFVDRLTQLKGEQRDAVEFAQFAGRATFDDDIPDWIKSDLGEPVESVWDAEIGITMAQFAIAETGSLVLSAKEGRSRLNSLAPPIHAVLIDPRKTVASLEDAFAQMPNETSVIISGPSRTADVEGIMVMGVHGPKSLWVVPISANEPE